MRKIRFLKALPLLFAALLPWTGCEKDDGFFLLDESLQTQQFSCIGGRASVPVNTNTSFTASVTSGGDWIHLIIPGMSVTVVVDPLLAPEDRTGSFEIRTGAGTKTVNIVQNAVTWDSVPEQVSLNNATLTFSATISASSRLVFDLPEWISAVDTAWVSGQKTYTFAAGVYLDPASPSRSAQVAVSTQTGSGTLSRQIDVQQTSYTNDAVQLLARLWETDPIGLPGGNTARYSIFESIDDYCSQCDRPVFRDTYLVADETLAAQMEQDYGILSIYRFAFDTVLEEVSNTVVEQGTTRIWALYNSGFIFKTPSACWGMDINHRYAALLEPYLDFMTISHADADHMATDLQNLMVSHGKPVLSSFFNGSSAYMSKVPTTYHIGNLTISTAITDENANEPDCMTVFRISTGADGGNLDLVHIGDSDCRPAQFASVQGDADLAIMRGISSGYEVRILGIGTGQIDPSYILLGHQQELRHYVGQSPRRASILSSISDARNNYGRYASRTSIPFWGTSLLWDGSSLLAAR